MTGLVEDPYASGILDRVHHARLVADIDRIARQAGIPRRYIWTPLANNVSAAEQGWVRQFHQHGAAGLCGLLLVGKPDGISHRMASITGALLRNFVDARLVTLQDLLAQARDGSAVNCTCLAVPNFGMTDGSKLPVWQTAGLLGVLTERFQANRQTVLHVPSLEKAGHEWGAAVRDHLESCFTPVLL